MSNCIVIIQIGKDGFHSDLCPALFDQREEDCNTASLQSGPEEIHVGREGGKREDLKEKSFSQNQDWFALVIII